MPRKPKKQQEALEGADGYEVQYGIHRYFEGPKKRTVAKKTSKVLKKHTRYSYKLKVKVK